MQSLTPTQLAVLNTLASGQTVTAAAHEAGIHRTTVHHWCRTLPQFRCALDDARQSRADAFRDQLHELAAPALALIRNTIEDDSAPPALRLRAALAVLKSAMEPAVSQNEPSEEIHHNSSLSSSEPAVPPPPEQIVQTPRGASCPCGSGLKYKRCCGHGAPPVLSYPAPMTTSG
jgi:uncharacterized protein YecA (UPF0149 family)